MAEYVYSRYTAGVADSSWRATGCAGLCSSPTVMHHIDSAAKKERNSGAGAKACPAHPVALQDEG